MANAFDLTDLAAGIQWVLADAVRLATLGAAARARAVELWSGEVVAAQYQAAYRAAVRGMGDATKPSQRYVG